MTAISSLPQVAQSKGGYNFQETFLHRTSTEKSESLGQTLVNVFPRRPGNIWNFAEKVESFQQALLAQCLGDAKHLTEKASEQQLN